MRIVINFKNTEEDIELYNKLKKRSCLSGYIKDVLKGLEDTTPVSKEKIQDDISGDIDEILGWEDKI